VESLCQRHQNQSFYSWDSVFFKFLRWPSPLSWILKIVKFYWLTGSTVCYISPICPQAPDGRISTKLGIGPIGVVVVDVITLAIFFRDRLRDVDSVGVPQMEGSHWLSHWLLTLLTRLRSEWSEGIFYRRLLTTVHSSSIIGLSFAGQTYSTIASCGKKTIKTFKNVSVPNPNSTLQATTWTTRSIWKMLGPFATASRRMP